MKTNYEIRYAAHPEDAKHYDTARLRRDFLIEKVFAADEVNMVYSMYDRMIVGGAMPVNEKLKHSWLRMLRTSSTAMYSMSMAVFWPTSANNRNNRDLSRFGKYIKGMVAVWQSSL